MQVRSVADDEKHIRNIEIKLADIVCDLVDEIVNSSS